MNDNLDSLTEVNLSRLSQVVYAAMRASSHPASTAAAWKGRIVGAEPVVEPGASGAMAGRRMRA